MLFRVMYSEKLPRPMHSNQNVKLSEAPSDGLRVSRSSWTVNVPETIFKGLEYE